MKAEKTLTTGQKAQMAKMNADWEEEHAVGRLTALVGFLKSKVADIEREVGR
ncbi:MAG: hypothetical protein HY646_02105 [Acidobacteria bacterium]|nr:hypothetical protein [Acidobacteriota bacterium]